MVNGWFFVVFAQNLSFQDVQRTFKLAKMPIKSDNIVNNHEFLLYITNEQFMILSNFQGISLTAYTRGKKIIMDSILNGFLVRATEDWNPNFHVDKLGFGVFHVPNNTSQKSLSEDKKVFSISIYEKKATFCRYASGFVESGSDELIFLKGRQISNRNMNNAGLDGRGEIINVVDSGIDSYHCMFFDPNVETPIDKTNLEHRKIVRIDPWADSLDHQGGHGTHVSGIVAGDTFDGNCGVSLYNGIAPKAKLYISDIGDFHVKDDVSFDHDAELTANRMNQIGSYVSSNSWGYLNEMSEIRSLYDRLSWEFPNITYVFAAGNHYQFSSVSTPSDSKNVLSIGALTNSYYSGIEDQANRIVHVLFEKSMTQVFETTIGCDLWSYTLKEKNISFFQRETIEFIDERNPENYKNRIVLMFHDENLCDYISIASKNDALILISNSTKSIQCYSPGLPVLSSNEDDMREFLASLNITILFQPSTRNDFGVSESSSKGPSKNNLMKPELVAPGKGIYSANAGNPSSNISGFCNSTSLLKKAGTSMSTPIVSGLIALLHQFFYEGRYHNINILASSYLLRSVIISSSRPLDSIFYPKYSYGFGMPVLSRVLETSTRGLRIIDRQLINPLENHLYCIAINGKEEDLIITMSYLDPPLSKLRIYPLYSDLDLIVISPSKKIWLGNMYPYSQPEHFSTNERVVISKNEIEVGTYSIHVISDNYFGVSGPIYAIAVSGPFNHSDIISNSVFLNKKIHKTCSYGCLNGYCSTNGVCKCKEGYIGKRCEQKIQKIHSLEPFSLSLAPNQIEVFEFILENVTDNSPFILYSNFKPPKAIPVFCFSIEKYEPMNGDVYCFEQYMNNSSFALRPTEYPTIKNQSFVFLSVYIVSHINQTLELMARQISTTQPISLIILIVPLIIIASSIIVFLCLKRQPITEPTLLHDEEPEQPV